MQTFYEALRTYILYTKLFVYIYPEINYILYQMKVLKPTDAELEILQVLWEHGPSTVRFVNDLLSKQKNVGYTTTLKIMQIMADKQLLNRDTTGKTHIYKVAISQQKTQQQLIDKLKSEDSHIFSWAVNGLKNLRERGRFDVPARCKYSMENYLKDNDSVEIWL